MASPACGPRRQAAATLGQTFLVGPPDGSERMLRGLATHHDNLTISTQFGLLPMPYCFSLASLPVFGSIA
jgi:hypothetical protein